MRIVAPSFEEISDARLYQKIELCGRVCYKSEDKITETSAVRFVKNICTNQHGSVLEHYSLAFRVQPELYRSLKEAEIPFFALSEESFPIVSFNVRAYLASAQDPKFRLLLLPLRKYMERTYPEISDEACSFEGALPERITDLSSLTEAERDLHQRVTMRLTTDRGVTHELVRHRLASFSQESTRYCNYAKEKFGNEITVIRPVELSPGSEAVWTAAMEESERAYFAMLREGATPQIARAVLPNSLKTEICITASLAEWKLIFALRCAPQAHPDCRYLMCRVRDYFIEKGYIEP